MKFCIACGKNLKEGTKFCTACGTSIEVTTEQEKNVTDSDTTAVQQNEFVKPSFNHSSESTSDSSTTKSMSKKTKVMIGIVASIAVILFGTHLFISSYFDPMKDLTAMEEAISNNDMDTFLSFIEFEDDVTLDKESYYEYIQDIEFYDAVKIQYEAIIEEEKENPTQLNKEIIGVNGHPLFKVKNKSFLMGLYQGFTLHAVPVTLQVSSNLEKAEVTIHEKTLILEKANEHKTLGKFYPGEFDVTAATENEYGEFAYENTLNLTAIDEEHIDIDFENKTFYIYTDYGFEDAVLFMNDKNTKEKIGASLDIGPVPLDSNIKLHAEWKNSTGNIIRTESVTLQEHEDSNIYFEFDETKAIHADAEIDDGAGAGNFVLDFRDAYENAVNYGDYSEVESYLKPDSHAAKDLKGFINDMKDGYYYYEFEENLILGVHKKDDKTYEVETNELFTFVDDDGKVYEYDRDKMYTVEIIDKDFQISKIEYTDTEKSNVG